MSASLVPESASSHGRAAFHVLLQFSRAVARLQPQAWQLIEAGPLLVLHGVSSPGGITFLFETRRGTGAAELRAIGRQCAGSALILATPFPAGESDMHGQLTALGCTRRETPAMASTVAALPMEEPLPPGLRITPVDDDASHALLEAMQITALGQDFAPRAAMKRMFGLGPQGPIRHLLGWIGDQPVAAATVMCLGESTSLWGIATLPDFRGRGIGRAMTLAACRWTRGRGQALIRLYATPMGLPVYSRLGFRPCGSLGLYLAPRRPLGRKQRRPAGDARRPIGTPSAAAPWGGGIPQGTGTVIYRGVVRR